MKVSVAPALTQARLLALGRAGLLWMLLACPFCGLSEPAFDFKEGDRVVLLVVADERTSFLLSGNGDVISPDDGVLAIGSGGSYALAAARALIAHTQMSAREVAVEAMRIAGEICIYSNSNIVVEEL